MDIKEFIINNNLNGFDKESGTDKCSEHSFLDFYQQVFSVFADTPINILEIGTYKGGWAYTMHKLLTKSNITSIDIEDRFSNSLKKEIDYSRFNILIENAFSNKTISSFEETNQLFDIIIDDGPHTLESQLFSVQNYTKLLSNNGLLIIEDIQSVEILQYLYNSVSNDFFKKVVDYRYKINRWDDILLIVSRKDINYE